jgi:hypothetical protein
MRAVGVAERSLLRRLKQTKDRRKEAAEQSVLRRLERAKDERPVRTWQVSGVVDGSSDDVPGTCYFHKGLQQRFNSKGALYAAVIKQESPRYSLTVARKSGGRSFKDEQKIVCSAGKACNFFVCTRRERMGRGM